MFKKFIIILSFVLSVTISADAQLYAPFYVNYQGVGYFVLPNEYYYGQIYAGYPQGRNTTTSLTRRWERCSITDILTGVCATGKASS